MAHPVTSDTLITLKITINGGSTCKLQLPLGQLDINLPKKLRECLYIKPEQQAIFERFSDSAGGYIVLDPAYPAVFKTLVRAAKAKLKLRLKATVSPVAQELAEDKGQLNAVPQATVPPTNTDSKTTPASTDAAAPRLPIHSRDSTALDRRSVGSGIFQFRDALSTAPPSGAGSLDMPQIERLTLGQSNYSTAPFVTSGAYARASGAPALTPAALAAISDAPAVKAALGAAAPSQAPGSTVTRSANCIWAVHCNACDKAMPDVHYHCNLCDGGDYDLCETCVSEGKLCPGDNHWLIKRSIQGDKVVSSHTERVMPRKKLSPLPSLQALAEKARKANSSTTTIESKTASTKTEATQTEPTSMLASEVPYAYRTCNSCVSVMPECEFVTCTTCPDFDLCLGCHAGDQHGHHPAHGFQPTTPETVVSAKGTALMGPGRDVRHNALCDGCDKHIVGIRHKCLICPDWDFCNDCIGAARLTHPRHRFAALYEPIVDQRANPALHSGIYCDGPLCSKKATSSYISGVRYKCAICSDTDFCASCEAHPGNHHNRTHPLIKFKTPVGSVSVSTENEDRAGLVRNLGDHSAQPARSAAPASNLETTQLNVVADFKPIETEVEAPRVADAQSSLDVKTAAATEALNTRAPTHAPDFKAGPRETSGDSSVAMLDASFMYDVVPDGMAVRAGSQFSQVWSLCNSGRKVWPAGCSVRFVGGDNMLNVDNTHPASVSDITKASESNVIGREVRMGETIAFKVTLKAPMRPGRAISYWRLKTPEGSSFGHRLWCDVTVMNPASTTSASYLRTKMSAPAAPFGRNPEMVHPVRYGQNMQHAQYVPPMQNMFPMMPMQNVNRPDESCFAPFARTVRDQQREHAYLRQQRFQEHVAKKSAYPVNGAGLLDHSGAWDEKSQAGLYPAMTAEDKARKDAAKLRVEYIKAKIMRNREERARMIGAQRAEVEDSLKAKSVSDVSTSAAVDLNAESNESAATRDASLADVSASSMVFPKLEKESPESSTYQSFSAHSNKSKAAYVENEKGEVENVAAPSHADENETALGEDGFEDLTDELEVLSATHDEEDDDDDDYLLTDDEYDILDASDRE